MNLNDNVYICHNHTNQCIAFGTRLGFEIYFVNPFKKNFSRDIIGGISKIKMLYMTNIILFISNNNCNNLLIWDDNKRTIAGTIKLNQKILNFEFNRKCIIIITKNNIYLYNFNDLVLLKTFKTCNPNGICDFKINKVVFPGIKPGALTLLKLSSDISHKNINAHNSNIRFLNLSSTGDMIVSCSEKGTIFKLFDSNTGIIIKEFRRGLDYTKINELKFSPDNNLILSLSDKKTIHIYDINKESQINKYLGVTINNYIDFKFRDYSDKQILIEDQIYYTVFINNSEILAFSKNNYYILNITKNDILIKAENIFPL